MSKNLTTRLNVDALENREMMSVTSALLSGSVVTVHSNNSATSVAVENNGSFVRIRDLGSGSSWNFNSSLVSRVDFVGGAGNDRFVNYISSLSTRAWGLGGNDYLEGYNAVDYLIGGTGNDTLVGYGGNDMMWGESGNDVLRGMDGNDQLIGGDGNDNLNGGAGADKMWGGNGDDVIIAIDNGLSDWSRGDAGRDAIWNDSSWFLRDSVSTTGASTGDKVYNISSFANGADRTLNSDSITDPTATGYVYKRFSGRPLFASSGPLYTDIRQGSLGDCWLLAGLSAIAMDSPISLKQNVVDFGDGTYGVHLGSRFYRVDADLPAASLTSTNPVFAKFGAEGALWVAIVEKAYAHYRTGANSYASIEFGWGVEVNQAFNASSTTNNSISSYGSATNLANAMYNAWNNYQAVTIGFTSIPAGSNLIDDHMYTVVSFNRNAAGQITSVVLRNPWGYDGAGSDSDTSDGLVTVSIGTLFSCVGRLNAGRVA